MEKFLKDYVKMFAKCNDEKLSKEEIKIIVENLQNTDEIWTTLDYYIDNYIGDLKLEI